MSEDRLSDIVCSKCGGALYEDDKFCSDCGEEVPRCPNCGAIITKGAKFCIKCRFNLKAKNECPACGTALPKGALFCPECGADAPGASPAPAPAPAAKSALRGLFGYWRKHYGKQPAPAPAPAAKPAPSPAPRFEARVGSYVKFGKYPQEHGDTPEPIEWLVLENDGKTALVLAKYGLDCKQFDSSSNNWRDCDLRKWLNGEFLQAAFSAEERKQIAESKISTSGCGETDDKVFCLSIEEAWKYFGNVKENYGCTEQWHSSAANETLWVNRERACKPTAYAVLHGALQAKTGYYKDKVKGKASEWWFDNCWFWLRSPGSLANYAAIVDIGGAVRDGGGSVYDARGAVRPALRIML